jgi:hypothetical protein
LALLAESDPQAYMLATMNDESDSESERETEVAEKETETGLSNIILDVKSDPSNPTDSADVEFLLTLSETDKQALEKVIRQVYQVSGRLHRLEDDMVTMKNSTEENTQNSNKSITKMLSLCMEEYEKIRDISASIGAMAEDSNISVSRSHDPVIKGLSTTVEIEKENPQKHDEYIYDVEKKASEVQIEAGSTDHEFYTCIFPVFQDKLQYKYWQRCANIYMDYQVVQYANQFDKTKISLDIPHESGDINNFKLIYSILELHRDDLLKLNYTDDGRKAIKVIKSFYDSKMAFIKYVPGLKMGDTKFYTYLSNSVAFDDWFKYGTGNLYVIGLHEIICKIREMLSKARSILLPSRPIKFMTETDQSTPIDKAVAEADKVVVSKFVENMNKEKAKQLALFGDSL